MNRAAIVTLAVGAEYQANWCKYSQAGWQEYAHRHGLDVFVLTEPLDPSPRAASRSVAWQKCLVLQQPFVQQYEQIVLLDSDIVINPTAPNICEQVPAGRVGGTISGSHIHADLRDVLLARMWRPPNAYRPGLRNWLEDQSAIYGLFGLPPHDAGIVQTGVLVAEKGHAGLFHAVYDAQYPVQLRTYEQIPLSHALLAAGVFHEIDTRFNSVLYEAMLVHFPYLQDKNLSDYDRLAAMLVEVQYHNNFFLHFAMAQHFLNYLPKRP